MYYLDLHQLYRRASRREKSEVRSTLNRDFMMGQKLKHQHSMCFFCGTDIDMSDHLDHLIPVFYGGTNRNSNLVASCKPCNMTKMVDQIEITNPYTIRDYLRKQEAYNKWIKRIDKHKSNYVNYRFLVNNPPKKVSMAITFRADLFKEI